MSEIKCGDTEIESEEMRVALTAIANEMQRFHNESLNSCDNENLESGEIMLDKLVRYKTALKLRKEEIKSLRENLKTACLLAKTMSTAKENATASLSHQLNLARNQYLELAEEQNENIQKINNLTTENQSLHNKIEHFSNCIQLGYKELQRVRNEPLENIPALKQLQHIILCCGEYYADYCNKWEKYMRLEQKYRFVKSKLCILETNLETAEEELRNLRVQNIKLNKEKMAIAKVQPCMNIDRVYSQNQISGKNNNIADLTVAKLEVYRQPPSDEKTDLNLTVHLNMVQKLIDDQDDLISILKTLSKEIINGEAFLN